MEIVAVICLIWAGAGECAVTTVLRGQGPDWSDAPCVSLLPDALQAHVIYCEKMGVAS